MAEDSHPRGGRRSHTRHNLENMGGFGVVWLILNRMDGLSSAEQTVALGVGMALLSGAAKIWNEYGLTGKLLKKVGLGALVALLLTGCGVSIGKVTPHEFEGENGQTIIACEMTGVQFGAGDGGVCQNAEGGHVSDVFAWMVTGIVDSAGRILGAVLSPLSALGSAGDSLRGPPPTPQPGPYRVEEPAPEPIEPNLFE